MPLYRNTISTVTTRTAKVCPNEFTTFWNNMEAEKKSYQITRTTNYLNKSIFQCTVIFHFQPHFMSYCGTNCQSETVAEQVFFKSVTVHNVFIHPTQWLNTKDPFTHSERVGHLIAAPQRANTDCCDWVLITENTDSRAGRVLLYNAFHQLTHPSASTSNAFEENLFKHSQWCNDAVLGEREWTCNISVSKIPEWCRLAVACVSAQIPNTNLSAVLCSLNPNSDWTHFT